jgi:UDP-arabinose 4-epimerase
MVDRTILVTGGAGFIGSHTCQLLRDEGFNPVVYDNLSTGHREFVKFGPFVHGDICDGATLRRALDAFKPEAVIHFAASAYVGESVTAPDRYYQNNVVGLLSVLDSMKQCNVTKVVFSSSCATYGIPDTLPIAETLPQRPINPYGETKLIGERIIRDYAQAFGLKAVMLRYFNASGADRGGLLREVHDPETHLIPRALMAAAGTIPHLDVFGDDYPTEDGTCVRDYVHVEDLADGHLRALRYLDDQAGPAAFNLGTGKGTSIREIIACIEEVFGVKIPVRVLPRRPGDPASLYADASLAGDVLQFKPRHSDLRTIIASAGRTFGLGA